jgi:hypothetical protein
VLFSVRKGRTSTLKIELAIPARKARIHRRKKFLVKQTPNRVRRSMKAAPINGYFLGMFSRRRARGIAVNPEPKKLMELKRAIFSLEKPASRRNRFRRRKMIELEVLVIKRKYRRSLQLRLIFESFSR